MKTARSMSLRRQLLWLLLGGATAGWLVTLALTYRGAHHEIDELFDAQLVQAAQALLALTGHRDDDDDIATALPEHHKYQKALVFQIWSRDGQLLLRSPAAPARPLTDADGFSAHEGWRYYAQTDHDRRVIVGEDHDRREHLARDIAGRLLLPALFGLPLLGLWVWFATRRALAPLDAIAASVGRRSPDHLGTIEPAAAPSEVRPLVLALNHLFARVADALERERRFTGDAAHELRTPLAALATQAEVAMRARDDTERRHAIEQIATSAQRAGHLVDQLLTLTRAEPAAALAVAPIRLDRLAAEVCASHGDAALERSIALELDAPAALTVRCNADLVAALLRNLVDNAVRYGRRGGTVLVQVRQVDGASELSVTDDGPGIDEADRGRATDRFTRMTGQATSGSGLGLSIVAAIARSHGATLTLHTGPGAAASPGLAVRVRFPSEATVGGA